MDRLIAKLPEGAHVVLDHCLERSSRDDDDPTLMVSGSCRDVSALKGMLSQNEYLFLLSNFILLNLRVHISVKIFFNLYLFKCQLFGNDELVWIFFG